MEQLLTKLSTLHGISGFEYLISDKIAELIAPYADEVYKDTLGSVIAVKRSGKPNAKKIMIEGHIDEIGLMVKNIDKNGFITFANIGGVDRRILPGAEVIIHGKKDIPGIIGAKPPHLQTPEESKKSMKPEDMSVDTGYEPDKVRELVSVGDSITFACPPTKLAGTMFSGKTLDDRAGIAAVINVLKNLQKVKTEVDVYAVCSVSEEVGCRGAKTAAYDIAPDIAVAIDVCHAITPDNSENAFDAGSGTVITIGPNIHPKVADRLFATAKRHNIKIETDVDGGNTGTDAWVIQVSGGGVPTALLSIPLKYMHTSVETLDIKDVEATSDLLTFFISELDSNTEEWLCF